MKQSPPLTEGQEHPPQPVLPVEVTREVGRKLEETQEGAVSSRTLIPHIQSNLQNMFYSSCQVTKIRTADLRCLYH